MTATAYTYPAEAWMLIDSRTGDRALRPDAELVVHYERPLERKRKRSKVDRRKERSLADYGQAGTEASLTLSTQNGRRNSAENRKRATEERVLNALAEKPELRTLGTRTLVSGNLVRWGHQPKFLVKCTCGSEQHVGATAWIDRTSGRTCTECARKQRALA